MKNNAAIKALLALLTEDDTDDDKEALEAAKAAEERAEAQAKAAAEAAEAKALEEALAAAKAGTEDKSSQKDGTEESDKDREIRELREKNLKNEIRAGVKGKNLDGEFFDALDEFLAYDKMKGEDGNSDPEKIEKLVNTLSSIALREPPKGGGQKNYDPASEGLSKYLNKN